MSKYLRSEASSSYSLYPSLEKSESKSKAHHYEQVLSLGTDPVALAEATPPPPGPIWLPQGSLGPQGDTGWESWLPWAMAELRI